MSILIRPAQREDGPRMMDLIRELAEYEKASEQVTVSMEEFIDAGFGENPVWAALLAETEGQIVGMSLYYTRYSTWKGRQLYLEDIVVTQKMRGKGYGKLLLDHTIAFAKQRGYSGITWQVLDWNQSAIDFYKKYNTKFEEEWINVKVNF